MENRSLVIQVKSETEVTSYDYIDVVREIELTTNRMVPRKACILLRGAGTVENF